MLAGIGWLLAGAVAGAQPAQIYERALQRNINQVYLLQVPPGYDAQRNYPLLIVVHGEEETAQEECDRWSGFAAREQLLLLCPQFRGNYKDLDGRENVVLMQILFELQAEFPYNREQVFLVGYSDGAEFAQEIAFRHPNIVSGVAVLAADDYVEQIPDLLRNRKVRFLLGVGEKDAIRTYRRAKRAERFYNKVQKLNYDIRFSVYPAAGHAWTPEMQADAEDFVRQLLAPPPPAGS